MCYWVCVCVCACVGVRRWRKLSLVSRSHRCFECRYVCVCVCMCLQVFLALTLHTHRHTQTHTRTDTLTAAGVLEIPMRQFDWPFAFVHLCCNDDSATRLAVSVFNFGSPG